MLRPVLTAMTVVALALAGAPATQAQVAPDKVSPTRIAPAAVRIPSVVSPRIGYVYGAGITDSGMGITVYAQQADGTLTKVQDVVNDDAVHSLVIVRLKSGRALYDLTRHQINAYHINSFTGRLTAFAVPKLLGPVGPAPSLAAYDPLAHGLTGQPMLVTSACGTATLALACPSRLQTFLVDPVTGALTGSLGAVGNSMVVTDIAGDGFGRFAYGLIDANSNNFITFVQAKVVAGKTVLVVAGQGEVGDAPTGSGAPPAQMGSAIVITSFHTVQFSIAPVYAFNDLPPGVGSYNFGSMTATAEVRADAFAMKAIQGTKLTYFTETGGTTFGPGCAIEAFGAANVGSAAGATIVPCAGSPANVSSLFAQGGYIYAGRYQEKSLGYHDTGTPTLTPSAQSTVPAGIQMYSWAGFLFGKPTVSVPLKVTGKGGIPVTIGCQQTCAGSTSALIKIAGLVGSIRIPTVAIKAHAPGVFTVKIVLSASVRAKITAAIKAKKKVTATTTTKVVATTHSVTVAKVSTFTA